MLLTRKEITQQNPIISSEISAFQKIFYDEDLHQDYKKEGKESVYLELYDHLYVEKSNYQLINKIIGFEHSAIKTYTNKLTQNIKKLLEFAGVKTCYVLIDLKQNFCGDTSDEFKPLAQAYQKLENIVGKNSYTEAFHVKLENIGEMLEIIFWITRCDPDKSEYIFFFDAEQKLRFNICKYGNIHLTEFNQEILTEKVLESLNWTVITWPEIDQFTEEDNGIEGRKIIL